MSGVQIRVNVRMCVHCHCKKNMQPFSGSRSSQVTKLINQLA